MSNIKGELNKRVFDNIEEINRKFGVDLKLPDEVPEGCNLLCYEILDLYSLCFFHHYKLDGDELYHYAMFSKEWRPTGHNLDQEILQDAIDHKSKYIYLHLNESKGKFTPERLLGVETTLGFIVDVFGKDYTNPLTCFFFETTDGTSYSTYNDGVKFYISDDSDETVSFEEYVKLFYNTENT